MINCPNCKNELPEEANFCPYCMIKLTDIKNISSEKNKTRYYLRKMSLRISISLIVIILIGIIFYNHNTFKKHSKNSEMINDNHDIINSNHEIDSVRYENTDNNTDNSVNTDNVHQEIPDYTSYCGKWYNEECTDGRPSEAGGYELDIYAVENNTVLFSLASYQLPPALRVAQIENMTAILNENKPNTAEFMFSNDGWDNAGTGSIVFLENNKIYVNVKLTSINSNSMWDLNTDHYFKCVSENDIQDYVDFMNVLGNEYSVVRTKLGADAERIETENKTTYYYYDGIIIVEVEGMVTGIYINYTNMSYDEKQKYNFSFGINGLSTYKYISNKFKDIRSAYDEDDLHITTFDVDEYLSSYKSHIVVAFDGDKIVNIAYELDELP